MTRRIALSILLIPLSGYSNLFIEGNFGQSVVDEVAVNATTDTNDGQGMNVNIGYMFNHYIGIETGYTQYANADLTENSTSGSDERVAMDIAARIVWPIKEGIQLFTKWGVGSVTSTLSEELSREDNEDDELTNTNLYYGIGFGYEVNKNFMLNMQYNTVNGSATVGDSTLISFGATLFLDNKSPQEI